MKRTIVKKERTACRSQGVQRYLAIVYVLCAVGQCTTARDDCEYGYKLGSTNACEIFYTISVSQDQKKNFKLPNESKDHSAIAKRKQIVHADTLALFSAGNRVNKGRKNHRNRGQTASIYMQDRFGGAQVGTLAHVMGTRGGWIWLDSIPDQKAATILPILRNVLPEQTPLFTDEGYKYLWNLYKNHRMVNHSKKSVDGRYKYARDRWCQRGVNNQIAEGLNSVLKCSFRQYRHFDPKYSSLYLNEFSFIRNLNYFGMERLTKVRLKQALGDEANKAGVAKIEGAKRCAGVRERVTQRVTPLLPTNPRIQQIPLHSIPSTRTSTNQSPTRF